MKSKIILIGMMGSGKSTIAQKLAHRLGFSLFECDEIFEKKFKIKIKDYFKQFGEENFRKEEENILKDLIKKDNFIISTGGGVVLNKNNRNLIFNDEILSIYLKSSVGAIFDRIKNNKNRPLLNVENPKKEIEKILNQREVLYKQAKLTIENENETIDEIVDKIIKEIAKNV
mgnify:CR=1 FL=1